MTPRRHDPGAGDDAGDGQRADGSRERFEAFVARCRPRLRGLVLRTALQTGADDHALFSHVLEVLWRRWEDITPDDDVRLAFAATTVARAARAQGRRSAARHEVLADDEAAAAIAPVVAGRRDTDDPLLEILRRERRMAILTAVAGLPETERDIMVLRVGGMSRAAIAAELELGPNEVRAGMERAKRQLRRALDLPGGDRD